MPAVALMASESMEIAGLAELRTAWLESLAGADSIMVDLSKVERVDTAGLQMLLALAREAGSRRVGCSFQNAGPLLRSQAEALGMATELFEEAHGTST